ncbi:enoyl-CoA hydratase-related protein [Breoghania sp. L-A4]|uniref:enoyl-CoA hydratase-related protein n=1 Tax=Breoghania sp. L-A4 TaxID=2304600 RepID=UPI0019681018|nr:enoyl-CoA hydratase-related protein [Breoghania sp. L-A4]
MRGTGETLAHAEGLARRLAAGPRAAQASIKALMNAAQDADFASQLDRERDAMAAAFAAPEAHEGIQAFLEKRRPHFKNPQDD